MSLHHNLRLDIIGELTRIFKGPLDALETIADDPRMIEELQEESDNYYKGEEVRHTWSDGMDTYPREIVHDVTGIILTDMNWPCYGDSQETKDKFFAAMTAALAEKGLEWNNDK